MSDGVIPVPMDVSDSTVHTQLHSAGSMLRKAREAAGLHVAALAVSMKVPVKKLEALESDRFDLLPDMVFVRALASSVCRTLKIDPAPVLEKLPNTSKPQLVSTERDINTPFDAYGSSAGLSLSSMVRKPVVLLVLVLLLAAGGVFFFPGFQKHKVIEETVTTPTQVLSENPQPVVPAPQDGSIPLAKTVGVPEGLLPPAGLQPAEVAAPVVIQNSTPTPTPTEPVGATTNLRTSAIAPTQTDKAPEIGAAKNASPEMLVLKAKAPCWVKVVDAKGGVQVLKIVAAGETVGVAGVAPLSVVIGAADAMNVEVHGKPFSLVGIAKDNVARFEVK